MTITYIEDGCRATPPKNKNQVEYLRVWFSGLNAGDVVNTPLNPVLYRA